MIIEYTQGQFLIILGIALNIVGALISYGLYREWNYDKDMLWMYVFIGGMGIILIIGGLNVDNGWIDFKMIDT